MLRDILTLSGLIAAVLLVRAAFKNRVPKRMIYALWLVVLLKLCLPGALFALPVLPAEEGSAPVNTVKTAQTEEAALPAISAAPAAQAPFAPDTQSAMPAQTAAQPEQTATKPGTKPEAQTTTPDAQEPAKPAAKILTTAQILRIVCFGGSALLGV